MFKLVSYYKPSSFRLIGPAATKLSYNVLRFITTTRPPSPYQKGHGLQISEDFARKLKHNKGYPKLIAPTSTDYFKRFKVLSFDQKYYIGCKTLPTKMNSLVGIINGLNEESYEGLKKNGFTTLEQAKKKIAKLIDALMSQPESRTYFLKWAIENKIFSTDAFRRNEERMFFVQELSHSCIKYSAFSNWDSFGSAFQDFMIQVWNDVPQENAEAFCSGITSQVSPSLKEKAYNAILECFNFHILPGYSRKFGNRLLIQMGELGLSPSVLVYSTVFEFNFIASRFNIFTPEEILEIKTIYYHHKARMTYFGPGAWCSLLLFYSNAPKDGPSERFALLELASCIIDGGANLVKKHCESLLEAAEYLLDQFHSEWRTQEPAKIPVSQRIRLIIQNASHIDGIPTASLLSILLACYHNLVISTGEENISYTSTLLQALVESGAALGTCHFESVLRFYSKAGFSFDLGTVLAMLENSNLAPSDKIFLLALNSNLVKSRAKSVLLLYNSVVDQQAPMLKSISKFMQNPEILSSMALVSANLDDLVATKNFWESCRNSGQALSSKCFQNALNAFLCFIPLNSKDKINLNDSDLYSYLLSIRDTLESNPPEYLHKVYFKLIEAYSKYHYLGHEVRFEDYRDMLTKCVFDYRRRHLNSAYMFIFKAFQYFLKKDPSLRSILRKETVKVVSCMLKYHVRASCDTYYQLLTLAQMFKDFPFLSRLLKSSSSHCREII